MKQNTYRMCGLSNGDSNQDYTDIDFAIYPAIGGALHIYEAGVHRGAFGTYVAGDRLRVAVEGGVVKYRKNGTLLYTSSVNETYPLLADAALYSSGATLTNVVISGNLSVAGGTEINWLVADQLGTPRMIIDKTGSLANVKRHDYLPFGEEQYAGQGVRTPALGYTSDTIRQKFTLYERDGETQLDYAQARYYSSQQGRFTSVDPLQASASIGDPQTFNRYTYAMNAPANFTIGDALGDRDERVRERLPELRQKRRRMGRRIHEWRNREDTCTAAASPGRRLEKSYVYSH